MAGRFANLSKYRNAVLTPGKSDEWLRWPAAAAVPALHTQGDRVPLAASATAVAARAGHSGSTLVLTALAPLLAAPVRPAAPGDTPRAVETGAPITDLAWAPFDPTLLAVGHEGRVTLWRVTPDRVDRVAALTTDASDGGGGGGAVAQLAWSPSIAGLLAAAAGRHVLLYTVGPAADGSDASLLGALAHPETVQSVSWRADSTRLATVAKDNQLRVWDPRDAAAAASDAAPAQPCAVMAAHAGVKPSLVQWIGDSRWVFCVGFSAQRSRDWGLWDVEAQQRTADGRFDTSPGILTPHYDADTGMLFLVGRGDAQIRWLEIDSARGAATPCFQPTAVNTTLVAAALVPKWQLDVMQGEVARLLLVPLAGDALVPVTVRVPRRSYVTFHDDLFPDAVGAAPGGAIDAWRRRDAVTLPPRFSLDPSKRPSAASVPPAAATTAPNESPSSSPAVAVPAVRQSTPQAATPTPTTTTTTASSTMAPTAAPVTEDMPPVSPTMVEGDRVTGAKAFRFLAGKPSVAYDDLRGFNPNLPFECNGFAANDRLWAVALAGSGGRIGLWDRRVAGCRLPAPLPFLTCGADLMDFAFDPFTATRLVSASDDGRVQLWDVASACTDPPHAAATGPTLPSQPTAAWTAHAARIQTLAYHPSVAHVLLTAAADSGAGTLRLWDVSGLVSAPPPAAPQPPQPLWTAVVPEGAVLAVAFSLDGRWIAVSARDRTLRVLDARTGALVGAAASHEGLKGARIGWLADHRHVFSVGFGAGSRREVLVVDTAPVSAAEASMSAAAPVASLEVVARHALDTSPSLLIPYLDEDVNLLYLSGRGESQLAVVMIVVPDASASPGTSATATASTPTPTVRIETVTQIVYASPQQAHAFLSKASLDVANVEIARALRCTLGAQTGTGVGSAVEDVSITVPRLRKTLFQDDLYGGTTTRDTTAPRWPNAAAWRTSAALPAVAQRTLQPAGMACVSTAPRDTTRQGKYAADSQSLGAAAAPTDAERKAEMMAKMRSVAQDIAESDHVVLEQDQMEGVAADEWD